MLGVCCVVTGIILGALHMTVGNSFLTLSLMFIGECIHCSVCICYYRCVLYYRPGGYACCCGGAGMEVYPSRT
jgi:hypothetical protein